MKKHLLALTITSLVCSGYAVADEKEEIDMSSPTEAYTALGIGYGNEGINLKAMYMTSEPGDARKTGFIIEANDITDQEGGSPQFSGIGATGPQFNSQTTNTNYRFRYGSLNTNNGLGNMVDAVIKDHPFYGKTAVVQAGALATIPVGENAYIWPVALLGGVVVEDNMDKLTPPGTTTFSSSGVDWASTIYSAKIYARYKFNDKFWLLGAWTYTDDLQGKSWSDKVSEGGLELSPQQIEVTVGYQITTTQNLRFNFHSFSESGSSDKFWVEYNYAF
jgi:hypothetical protein